MHWHCLEISAALSPSNLTWGLHPVLCKLSNVGLSPGKGMGTSEGTAIFLIKKQAKKKKSIFACGRLLNKSPHLGRLGAAVSPSISFSAAGKIFFSSSPSETKSCYCRHLRCLHLFIFLLISVAVYHFISSFSCAVSSALISEKSVLAKLCH